jgi:predicted ATPase
MHHLRNYKGFVDARINLLKPFSLLIGPNGSGKSNVIEAIELLSFVARGQPLHEIGDIGKGSSGLEVRGGLQACGREGKDRFQLGFFAAIEFEGQDRPFWYDVGISARPYPQIIGERLKVGDWILYETLPQQSNSTSRDLTVQYNNFARGGKKPQVQVSSDRSILSQYREFAASNRKYRECLMLVRAVMFHLQASFVFDPDPKLMHSYERVGDTILKRNGSNLSAVLYGLSTGDENQRATLQRLLEKIRQLPDEPYVEFDFTRTDLGDVVFGFQESSGYKVDARVLSDGTLRTLAILTAFETVSEGSRIVVEEFDNGLHPSRVGILTEAIAEVAQNRELNVLVTTHNPATMDFLTREQLDGVVVCTWDDEKGSASLVRLNELPRYDEFLERGRLGDLVTRRVIDQYLVPGFEEQQKKKALAWMEDLS